MKVCNECGGLASWNRAAQFSGDLYFCERDAKKCDDFGVTNNSHFVWEKVEIYVTKHQLVAEWQKAREGFKLDGAKLTPTQQAGLLIEEIGSVTGALRLVQVAQDVPFLIEFDKPELAREVREILSYAWKTEQGDKLQSIASLIERYDYCADTISMSACPDAKLQAGMLLKEHGDRIERFVHDLGMGLYSPMHFTHGFAAHFAARETLFVLEMVLWTEKVMAER
ncbi:MAG: hypothetical protein ABIS59_02805 [Candidatus Saccharibacteria bacterium]